MENLVALFTDDILSKGLIVFGLIFFCGTFFFQLAIKRENFLDASLLFFSFALTMLFSLDCLNHFHTVQYSVSPVILIPGLSFFVFWLILSLFFGIFLKDDSLNIGRNIFFVSGIILGVFFFVFLFPHYWLILISIILGISCGLPTIYFWKSKGKKKEEEEGIFPKLRKRNILRV